MSSEPAPKVPPELLERYAIGFSKSETLKSFGLKLWFPDQDHVRIDLDPVRAEHRGGLGTRAVNGGVLAAIFDLAIGASAALLDPTKRTATVELSMQFQRPTHGARIHAEGRIEHAAGRLIFTRAEIFDEAGQICARCRGVVVRSDKTWASGDHPGVD